MPTYTNLNGITGPSQQTLLPQLKTNVAEFFNWGLLGRGFFAQISGNISGAYGGNYAQLRLVNDPNYTLGQVWEGSRINWVWETGVENGYSPTIPSGVYVNSTFYPATGTGTYAHNISYPLGRVVFNTAISTTGIVKCFHSEKRFQIGTEDQPWAKEIIFNTYRVDQASGTQILGQNRVQMPSLIIGAVANREQYGMAIGGGQWVDQDLYFLICAETPWDRDKLVDVVTYQNDKTIRSYNTETVAASGRYPLDLNGFRNSSGWVYPDLIRTFYHKTILFKDMRVSEILNQQPFFKAIVRCKAHTEMPELS